MDIFSKFFDEQISDLGTNLHTVIVKIRKLLNFSTLKTFEPAIDNKLIISCTTKSCDLTHVALAILCG